MDEDKIRSMLLNEDDDLSQSFTIILEKIFLKFSGKKIEQDNEMNVLGKDELVEFSKACNEGSSFSKEEMEELFLYFGDSGKETLSKSGFMDMYHTQTTADPTETWKDLKALGFDKDIIELSKADSSDNKLNTSSQKMCNSCGEKAHFCCSKCKAAHYCKKECQEKDWKISHKDTCMSSLQIP